MHNNSKTRKALSVIISAVMVLTMFPLMAFTSVAATGNVYHSGDWLQPAAAWNSSMNGFSSNGAGADYATSGLHDTVFYFMQTEDNQVMTYSVDFYAKKNNTFNSVKIKNINTNYNSDAGFAAALARTTDLYPELQPEWWSDGGGSERFVEGPVFYSGTDDVDVGSGVKHFLYTVNFVADGSAVYNPEWEIHYRTASNSWIGYNEYKTSALNYNGETSNWNPVFTIKVVDLREVNTLIDIAQDVGLDYTTYTGNRDFSGATYYDQDTVDSVVAALREALLCDYSALDAQIARAAQIETVNIDGALGGKLYDEALYNAFTDAYNQARAVDRFLMADGTGANEATIANAAAALEEALDNLLPTKKALITYYVDGAVYAQNTASKDGTYNFHDVTDKFIADPTKAGYDFTGWKDSNGNYVRENTVILGDLNVYADFYVSLNGTRPLSSSGRWDHMASESESDGRGENYVTMWVQDTNFNFVQIADDQTFSFYTDFTAYKNAGSNSVKITGVYLLNDAETNTFSSLIEGDVGVSCITGNATDKPEDQGEMPGIFMNNYESQKSSYFATWRYIYDFRANGAATYTPKWNINYTSGWTELTGTTNYDLTYSGSNSSDSYVSFTINVTDLRELINMINKAESIYNNRNSGFTADELETLRTILDNIYENYTLDGSVYYTQAVVDDLVNQIKQVIPDGMTIPCDYTDLDAAIALADEKRAEYNDNADNHYINEVWNNFMDAYNAATSVDRNLNIIESNANQTMIDSLTQDLLDAIDALTYQTHVNEPCDYEAADDILDEANTINNDNGQYDDDAYQNFEDAKQDLEDLLNLYDDEDGNNQQAIDDAVQALQDAIDALNDPANQNDPCDYTALNEAIAAAQSITNSDLFTPETYQALQDALTEANNVPTNLYNDDSGNNQQTIDNAAAALNEAIANLLADAITNAENADTTGMTDSSIQALDNAVDNAQTVAEDTNSTASEKADAINDITGAVDSLTPDKTELEQAITVAEGIDTTDLPQNLIDALEDAITNGQTVDNNDDATVQDIADAVDAIEDAIANILQNAIDEANATDTTGMTPESIQALEDAIAAAEDVLNDPDSDAAALADAIDSVENAVDGLTPDKTELEQAITVAEGIDTTDLPQELVDALEDAITNGQTVDNNDDATVQDIADAVDAIEDAIADILQNAIDEANATDTTGMTPESIQALEDAIAAAEDVLNDPDSDAAALADAIDSVENAVDGLTPDKTELEDAITAAETVDTTDLPQDLADALEDAITNGQTVDNDDDATVQEISDATDAINDALDDILQNEIDEAEAIDTTDMTDDAKQELEDAIQNAEDILNDPDSTPQEKADAINDIQEAIDNSNEFTKLIPTAADTAAVDRAETENYFVYGLDAADTSLSNVKTQFENDGRQIIAFRGETQLTDSDLVGTGCVIKCVSIKDPTVVYEQATVILYGDVNGDGLINATDYDAMFDEALFGQAIEGELFRTAGDVYRDGVIDGFDMAKVELHLTGAKALDQTMELL